MTDFVTPTQADREAAAALLACDLGEPLSPADHFHLESIQSGHADDDDGVQAFARHRISHSLHATQEDAERSGAGNEPWPGCFADLQQRRVTTLAKLGLMFSKMAGGEAAEVVGYDAADLYADVLMALAIEDADDTDIALEIARDHPEGDILSRTPKEPLPAAYWNAESGNFYDLCTRKGMGQDFYREWYLRRDEFPTAALSTPAMSDLQRQEYDGEALGRFGHHPDPAIDFECEVEQIESIISDLEKGMRQDEPIPLKRIERAMAFRVGGDPGAVAAKASLRGLENRAAALAHPAQATPSALSGDAGEGERVAAWLEQYPTPMNDLDMAMRIRDICAAIRRGEHLK